MLQQASDAQVRALWSGATIVPLDEAGGAAFSASARGDLRGPLLWLALAARTGRGGARQRLGTPHMSLPLLLDAFDRTAAGTRPRRPPAGPRRVARDRRPPGLERRRAGRRARRGRRPSACSPSWRPTPADAERWLSDLQFLSDEAVALYPQREALGEDEPHYEIAGERVETIEALLGGRLRMLVTTARAIAERTLVPASLEKQPPPARDGHRASGRRCWCERLEAMGYRRVTTVTEVAEFSVRGGIVDVYGFGMAAPARLEWWDDEVSLAPRVRPHDAALGRGAR